MKRAAAILICAILLLCAGAAQADPIDPVIIVRGGRGSINLTSLATINLAFPGQVGCMSGPFPQGTFPVAPGNQQYIGLPSMTCVFKNMTASAIYTLTFNITSAQLPLTLQCALLCSSFTQSPSGGTAVFQFNPPIPGVPAPINLREIAIDFINFNPGTSLATIFATPEPGTMALLATGLGALVMRRRKKKV